MDFNAAVDTARHSLRALNNVHLIQADLSALPLRDDTFDLAYAMGVLHHTPDPESAFARMAGAVKPSGGLAVMLHNQEGLSRRALEIIRQVTTRLPLSATLALTAAAIAIYYPCRLPVLGPVLRALCPVSLHPEWRRRWLDTFESCTATYQWPLTSVEVGRWFAVNRFADVEMLDSPICVQGRKELATARDEQSAPRRALVAGG